MLDDDMLVPPDLLARLLAHDKDVIGALYWQRGGAFHPVLMHATVLPTGELMPRFYEPFDDVLTKPGLYPVDVIGGGCMLFKVDIFRKLTPPYFWWESQLGTDIAICTRLKDAGVQVYVDTAIELGHIGEKQIITRHAIPLGTQVLGEAQELLWQDVRAYLGMPDAELESAMVQASSREQRQAHWHSEPRETWEQVRKFYTDFGDWHVLNLLYWAMAKRDAVTQWVLSHSEGRLKPKSQILDLGPGLGMMSLALAQRGHRVIAQELQGTPTGDFVTWRCSRHTLDDLLVLEFPQAVPETPGAAPVDAVLLISMLDHCWAPYETLEWAIAQLKPGGLLVCDYYDAQKRDDEPQHLVRYDPLTLPDWLRKHGLDEDPVYPFLWTKRA
jgi:2-polyprenyl-3-methyl-5-hydroxy-6-metoxy-1,4-benzoquinol methylase